MDATPSPARSSWVQTLSAPCCLPCSAACPQAMVTPQSLPSEDDEDRLLACLPASHACLELAARTVSIHGGLVALPLEHFAFVILVLQHLRAMSRPGASTSFPLIPAERRTAPPARSGQTPTAGQALRALLHLSDDSILPALSAMAPVDLARLHDLVSQTVFSSLVRTPSADGPPEPRLNWANESDPPAQPSQPFLAPDDPPVTPARPGSAQQLSDPTSSTTWTRAPTTGRT